MAEASEAPAAKRQKFDEAPDVDSSDEGHVTEAKENLLAMDKESALEYILKKTGPQTALELGKLYLDMTETGYKQATGEKINHVLKAGEAEKRFTFFSKSKKWGLPGQTLDENKAIADKACAKAAKKSKDKAKKEEIRKLKAQQRMEHWKQRKQQEWNELEEGEADENKERSDDT
eukprot:g50929.t1